MKQHKWIAIGLLVLLTAISFFKDELTPDYRNTLNAAFLAPENLNVSRFQTLSSHWPFWTKSMLYSLCFIAVPALVIHFAFQNKKLTQATFGLHLLLVIILYTCVFINSKTLDVIVVSKVNRYLHSPIITLFLWAAFTLTSRQENHE